MNESNKLWTKKFTAILIMAFFFFISLQMLTTGFPTFITEVKQNPTQAGLMTTVFMIAAILTRPFITYFIEKVNVRVMSMFALAFTAFTVALSYGHDSVGYLLFLRFLHGIGFGIMSTILATMATKRIPVARLGEGVGYYSLATSVGTSSAPMFAVAFIQLWSFEMLLVISVLLSGLVLVISFFMKAPKKETVPKTASVQANQNKISFKEYLFDKNALLPCLLASCFTISLGGVMSFLQPLGEEANIESSVPLFFLVMAIFMTIIRPISGRVFDSVGHKVIIYPAVVSGVIGLLLLFIAQNTVTLLIAGVFYGLAYGTVTPSLQAIAVGLVKKEKQGTANAMYYSGMDIGMAIGSTGLGILASYTNYHAIFGFSIICLVVLILIYTFVFVKGENKRKAKLKEEKDIELEGYSRV